MSTATITLRTKVVPRWIGMLGIAVAVVLLVSVGLIALTNALVTVQVGTALPLT